MTRCAWVVSFVAIAACASRTPTERERALSKLPAGGQLIAAADGAALSVLRPALDAARPFMPRSLDCVLDAALTSEALAVGVSPRVGATIVIVTRARVARCAALSRIESDVLVATVGAGSIAERPDGSVLASPRWSRAKSYLLRDRIALAVAADHTRVLAVAQPQPLEAWLAIDADDITAIERELRAWSESQRTTVLRELADALRIETRGSQLLVRANKLEVEQLGWLAADMLRRLDAPARAATTTFTCPQSDGDIVRCTDDTRIVVRSLATVLQKLVSVDTQPVVAGGDVIGIRLSEDAETLLRRGDVILGVDGHRISSGAQLYELARYLHGTTMLAVRRDGVDSILELSE